MAGEIGNNESGRMEGHPGEPVREERMSGSPDQARELGTSREGIGQGPNQEPGTRRIHGQEGSPLGTDPQEAKPLPGDPREAQEPQEPRSTHVAPGRHEDRSVHEGSGRHEDESGSGVVDQLREAWDKMRGKK